MRGQSRSLRALELPIPILFILALCLRTSLATITPWFPLLFWSVFGIVLILSGRYFIEVIRKKERPPIIVWAPIVMAVDMGVLYSAGSSLGPFGIVTSYGIFLLLWLATFNNGMLGVGVQPNSNKQRDPDVDALSPIADRPGATPPVGEVVSIPRMITVYKQSLLGMESVVGWVDSSGRTYRVDGPNHKAIKWEVDENGVIYLSSGEARASIGWVDESGYVYAHLDHPVTGFFTGTSWSYGPPTYEPGLVFQLGEDGMVCSVKKGNAKIVGRVEGTTDQRVTGALALVLLYLGA